MTAKKEPKKRIRKEYHVPKLTKYGRLRDLTAGGSGSAMEGSSGLKPRP